MREKAIFMKRFNFHSIKILLLFGCALLVIVHSQDQSGFISLDCGLPENSSYAEPTTSINYISDAAFISTGESKSVSAVYAANLQVQARTVRSFPDGIRNCCKVNTRKGTKYLIRATFLYGNYDAKNAPPQFDLHLGANFWDTVRMYDSLSSVIKEIVHFPAQDYVRVCLVNTGNGTPFLSALELRPLKNTTYEVQSGMSLAVFVRLDLGSATNLTYRYPKDALDRMWSSIPFQTGVWTELTTSMTVDPRSHIDFQPPQLVMSTAATPINTRAPMQFFLESEDKNTEFYAYFHFAELQELKANESRAFNINLDGSLFFGPIIPTYLISSTAYSGSSFRGGLNYSFTLEKLENSTLPPILNAFEFYTLVDLSQQETHQDDVDAVTNIKSIYGVKRNWDGDPCLPVKYLWTGLNCSNDGSDPPRITSLDLSSSGLTGEITEYIAELSMLRSLDLSNNNLTGSVPSFLSQLPNLRILNLGQNKLTGLIPDELIERSNDGSLSLSVEGNQELCSASPCKKKKKKKSNALVPIVASVGGSLAALLTAVSIFVVLKKKKKQVSGNVKSKNENNTFESKKRQFTYSEVVKITNNFKNVLGKGGFGTVYHGIIDDGTEVAVKIIHLEPPIQGSQVQSREEERRKNELAEQQYQQFQAEVKLLLTVYHGNLTSLVGYCKQGTNMALVYEYMANGDLDSHILGKQGHVLNWETRLQISIDAAQGLEYLHNGCKPPIIHRDIKPANILLTENFRAKLADFGLSKFFPTDDGTHVSTVHIAGTPGYLDPDLTNNSWLNEKSDVYSFGVVLLQIITGRPAIGRAYQDQRTHLSQWVNFMIDNGNIKEMVDQQLRGDFETNSVWKAVELAMACVSSTAKSRPNMSQVVIELRECLALELARKNNSSTVTNSTDSINYRTTEVTPLAR